MGMVSETIPIAFNNENFVEFRKSIVDQSFKYCKPNQCPELWKLKNVEHLPYVIDDELLPKTIHLHLDYNCNLKCPSCRTENYYNSDPDPTTSKILEHLNETYKNFNDEVLIYADGLGDIFASAAYRNWLGDNNLPKCFRFCITTNGNLLVKNLELLDKIHHRINYVIVSLDAGTEKTYKKIRGGNFQIVLDGISELKKRNIDVSTQFVVQRHNYAEIVDYINLCKTLKVYFIGLQKIDRWRHMTTEWWNENQIDDNPNVDKDYLIQVLGKLQNNSQVGLCGGLLQMIDSSVKQDKST